MSEQQEPQGQMHSDTPMPKEYTYDFRGEEQKKRARNVFPYISHNPAVSIMFLHRFGTMMQQVDTTNTEMVDTFLLALCLPSTMFNGLTADITKADIDELVNELLIPQMAKHITPKDAFMPENQSILLMAMPAIFSVGDERLKITLDGGTIEISTSEDADTRTKEAPINLSNAINEASDVFTVEQIIKMLLGEDSSVSQQNLKITIASDDIHETRALGRL